MSSCSHKGHNIKVKKVVTVWGPVELEEPVPNLKAVCSFIYSTDVLWDCSYSNEQSLCPTDGAFIVSLSEIK